MRRRFPFLFAFVCIFTAVGMLPAEASTVQTISAGSPEDAQKLAVDTDDTNDAVIAWTLFTGSKNAVKARIRSSSGALGTILTLATGNIQDPDVAVDSDGDAFVIWRASDGSHMRVYGRRLSSAGVLGTVQAISPAGETVFAPAIAMTPGGDAAVLWRNYNGSTNQLVVRRISAAGVAGSTFIVTTGGNPQNERLGVADNGNVVVMWRGNTPNGIRVIARTIVGSTLGDKETISPAGEDVQEVALGVDSDGDAVVVWQGLISTNTIRARRRLSNGTLSAVSTLDDTGALNPEVAVAPNGAAFAGWRGRDGDFRRARGRAMSTSGVWTPYRNFSASGVDTQEIAVDIDDAGNGTAAWQHISDSRNRVFARGMSPSAVVTPAAVLSGPTSSLNPAVAVDNDGDGVVAWKATVVDTRRIQATGVSF